MPAMRTYEVFEVRRCEVRASTPEDAVQIAAFRFDGRTHDKEKLKGSITKVPRVIALDVKEI